MKVNMGKYPVRSNRKIKVKIDPQDTYSLDHTLANIILPALIQLKNTKHGIPNEFGNVGGENFSSQLSFDFYTDTYNEAFDLGVKQWEEVLDKMIWSFSQIVEDTYSEKYHHGKIDMGFEETGKQFHNPLTGKIENTYHMVDKNPDEHWYDHVGHQLHEDRIQEGLELFGKYYRNLWD